MNEKQWPIPQMICTHSKGTQFSGFSLIELDGFQVDPPNFKQ